MRTAWVGGLAVLASGLAGAPAWAQAWLTTPEVRGTQTLEVGHATLRLPPGEWQPLAAAEDVPLQAGGTTLRIQTKVLAQRTGGKVVALIYVRSNESRSRWNTPADCGNRNVLWFDNPSEYAGTFDCLSVSYRAMKFLSNYEGLWHDVSVAAAPGGGIPRPMVLVDFNLASPSRLDFITVYLYVDPTTAGLPNGVNDETNATAWSKSGRSAGRQAYVAQVATWAAAYRKVIADAF